MYPSTVPVLSLLRDKFSQSLRLILYAFMFICVVVFLAAAPAYAADIQAVLADDAGSDAFAVRSSTPADVATIDSSGNVTITGCVRLDSGATECSTAEDMIVDGHVTIGDTTASTALLVDSNAAEAAEGVVTLQNDDGNIQIFVYSGNPNTNVTADIGDLSVDPTNGNIYIKQTTSGDAANWVLIANATTAVTAWDDIGDPDGAGTIDFTTFAQTVITGISDSGGGTGLTLTADEFGNGTDDVIAFLIGTDADDDPNFVPLRIQDTTGGTPETIFNIDSSGDITLGHGTTADPGEILLHDGDATDSFITTISANADVGADFTLTLPADDGSTDQFLQTDGSGNLSWVTVAGASGDITTVGDCAGPTCFAGSADDDGNSLFFEGSTTADGFETELTAADASADVTVTIPATTGTIVLNTTSPDISGTYEIQDDTNLNFGNDADYGFLFDATDDIFGLRTADTTTGTVENAMVTYAFDSGASGMTANQEVFEIGKGATNDADAGWTELFAVDEDGDVSVTGDLTVSGGEIVMDVNTAGNLLVGNAGGTAFDSVAMSGDCSLAGDGTITCDMVTAESVAYDDIDAPDADSTIAFAGNTNSWTTTETASDFFTITNTGAIGDVSVVTIEQNTGDATDGRLLDFVTTDTNVDAFRVADNIAAVFGDDDDFIMEYVDLGGFGIGLNLYLGTALTTAQADDVALITIGADSGGSGMDADQEIFEVGKGSVTDSDAAFTELFAVDEDGDVSIGADLMIKDDETIHVGDGLGAPNLIFDGTKFSTTFTTASGGTDNTDLAQFTFAGSVGAGSMTADQEIFEIGKEGLDDDAAGFTELFAVDEDGDVTIAGAVASVGITDTGVVDFSGSTSVEIPNSTSETTDTAGEIAVDTDGDNTNITHDVLQYGDATDNFFLIGVREYPSSNNQVLQFNSTNNDLEWSTIAGASGDIEDVFSCTSGSCQSITVETGDTLNIDDDVQLQFGAGPDWLIEFAEGDEDTLQIMTSDNNGTNDDHAMLTVAVDTGAAGMDADQEVFEIGKGAQDGGDVGFTELFSIDEDGDGMFLGDTVIGASTSATETLANAGFSLGGDDLFVAGTAGIEGNVYTDGSFIAGSTLTMTDGSITQSTGSSLAVSLGGNAGDDFLVDTDVLTVESDNNLVGINTTSPGAGLEIDVADGDNDIGLLVDANDATNNPVAVQIDNEGESISLDIDSASTTANIIDIDGGTLTTGAVMEIAVDNTFNADQQIFNITSSTALNSNTRLIEMDLTDGNGADVDLLFIDRDTDDARLHYDDANEQWEIDQGDGSGLVAIQTGSTSGDVTDVFSCTGGDCSSVTVETGETFRIDDDVQMQFGAGPDWLVEFAEGDEDTLQIMTSDNNGTNDDYAMLTVAVDTGAAGMDANQEVFEIGKGAQDDGDAGFTELFAVDEDGDTSIPVTNSTLSVGSTANTLTFNGTAFTTTLNIAQDGLLNVPSAFIQYSTATAPVNFFGRADGTVASPDQTDLNDVVGNLTFVGYDGTDGDFVRAAEIVATVDAAAGNNDMPGRLTFGTTADGGTDSTEAMRIDSSQNVGIDETSAGARLHITPDDADDTIGLIVEQGDTNAATNAVQIDVAGEGLALDINASATTGNIIDIDGGTLTTGAVMEIAVDNTFNADQQIFNITSSTALNSNTRLIEMDLTDGNGADVDLLFIDRDTDDARLHYDDANEQWEIDQGDGSGLVAIQTGSTSGDVTDVFSCTGGDCSSVTVETGETFRIDDDVQMQFGAGPDWLVEFAEGDEDTLQIMTSDNNGTNDDYAMLTVAVDTGAAGMDADQEVFEIGKGAQDDGDGAFTELFSVDEDGDADVLGHLAVGSTATLDAITVLDVAETFDSSDNCILGCIGTSSVVAIDNPSNPSSGVGILARVTTGASAFTLTELNGILVQNPNAGAGSTITDNIALQINDQTAGTNDYGIAIDGADTQALWVSAAADTTDAANGIGFGSSLDTNLYRSAADTLTTDDTFTSAGLTSTGTVDFSAATFEMPNGDSPTAPAADGQMVMDTAEGTLKFQAQGPGSGGIPNSSTDVSLPLLQSKDITLIEPDQTQGVVDDVPFFLVDSHNYPHGITVTAIRTTVSTDYTSETIELIHCPESAACGTETVIDSFTLTSADNDEQTAITSASVGAGNRVYVNLDDTPEDVDWLTITVYFYVNES